MTTMARKECSYGAEKLSPSLLFRCGEAPPEAQNSDLRHGNRDSYINFMKIVPLSGQISNKSDQIEQIK